jgi:hypothetical protein
MAPKISIIGIDNRSNLKYRKRLSIIILSNIAQPYWKLVSSARHMAQTWFIFPKSGSVACEPETFALPPSHAWNITKLRRFECVLAVKDIFSPRGDNVFSLAKTFAHWQAAIAKGTP